MDKESLTEKLLDLVEGRETPETWRSWWDEHETELETLLSRGEFLKLKPCRHGFQWVPVFGSQKGAIAILEKSGTAFETSNLYQEQYSTAEYHRPIPAFREHLLRPLWRPAGAHYQRDNHPPCGWDAGP